MAKPKASIKKPAPLSDDSDSNPGPPPSKVPRLSGLPNPMSTPSSDLGPVTPYDDPKADIVLVSDDNKNFHVNLLQLRAAR